MKLYIITVMHMDYQIIVNSLNKFMSTTSFNRPEITEWVFVDNCYPINPEQTSSVINTLCDIMNGFGIKCDVIKPSKNLGGHGGSMFAVEYFKSKYDIQYNDLILGYDPDSIPKEQFWLNAMIDVMTTDMKMAYLSLTHIAIKNNEKEKTFEMINNLLVMYFKVPEMFNVTIFRAGFLMEVGLESPVEFYGHIESVLWQKTRNKNLKNGYLFDHVELENPIPHAKEYVDWKRLHASGEFTGNFDKYILTLNV